MSARIYPAPPAQRAFPLRLVLAVMAGVPPRPEEVEQAHELLEHVAGGPLAAAHLEAAYAQVRAFLRHARPEFARRLPSAFGTREAFEAWCEQVSRGAPASMGLSRRG